VRTRSLGIYFQERFTGKHDQQVATNTKIAGIERMSEGSPGRQRRDLEVGQIGVGTCDAMYQRQAE